MSCQWIIRTVDSSNVVLLKLIDFDLEGPQPDCMKDYVEIYDGKGSSTGSSRIQLLCGQVSNKHFTSTGSYMTVVFHSDGSNNFKGFRFSYSSQNKPAQCNNGTIWTWSSYSDYLTSPGFPGNYSSNIFCQWSIRTNHSSSVVLLKLIDFDLEGPQPECTNDYVEIYDGKGSSTGSSRIQLLCGQVSNAQFTSTGSYMTVVFHSDGSNNFRGFRFSYSSQNKPALCGNTSLWASESTDTYLNSPNYPSDYLRNTDCEWHIRTYSSSAVIVLELVTFLLEDNSQKDYVEIHDGDSSDSPRIQLLCGQVVNRQFKSAGTSVTVVFHSDESYNFRGFSFKFRAEKPDIDLCTNNTLVATRTAKNITSPGYPSNYPSNMSCQWSITADLSSRVVVLKLLDFYLEGVSASCLNDYVAIYDGDSSSSPRIRLLCGQVSNTQFASTGPSMTVVFHSDLSDSDKGFKFEFTSLDISVQCTNTTLVATGAAKYITSPGYPNYYPSNRRCQWSIAADSSSRVVQLKLLDFCVEKSSSSKCNLDYVAIYAGDSPSSPRLWLLCGRVSNRRFIINRPSATVVFRSDGSNNYKGFKFEYTSLEKSAPCSNTTLVANGTAKYIASPGYPQYFKSYTNCHWFITAHLPSHIVVLKVLDFHLAGPTCTFVNVALYDGDSKSRRMEFLCGNISDTQYTSSGPSMTVVFHSFENTNFRGFKFEYTSLEKPDLCSDVTLLAKETDNFLTSPNYPNPYPSNMDCEWHITAGSYSSVVVLSNSQFSLDGHQSECTSDYVKIYDGPSTFSPLLKEMCGQMNDGKFVGTKSVMTVVFHSDGGSNYYAGFRFTYYSQENGQEKGQKSAGPGHTSTTVPLATSGVVVPIIVIVAICIRRIIVRRQLWNTQNRVLRPIDATGRANSLFIANLWTSNASGNPPYAGMENSQNASAPPTYNLNCNLNDNLPAYTTRSPGCNMNELPSPYSHDLPGGTAEQDRTALLQETGSAHDGVDSTLEGGAHINEGFNFTSQDEIVREHMTGTEINC